MSGPLPVARCPSRRLCFFDLFRTCRGYGSGYVRGRRLVDRNDESAPPNNSRVSEHAPGFGRAGCWDSDRRRSNISGEEGGAHLDPGFLLFLAMTCIVVRFELSCLSDQRLKWILVWIRGKGICDSSPNLNI